LWLAFSVGCQHSETFDTNLDPLSVRFLSSEMASPLEPAFIRLQNFVGGGFCGRRREPLNDSKEHNIAPALEEANIDCAKVTASFKGDSDTDENTSTTCGEMSCELGGDSTDEAPMDTNLPAEGSESEGSGIEPMPEPLPKAVVDAPPGLPPPPGPPPGLKHPDSETDSETDEAPSQGLKAFSEPPEVSAAPRVIQLFDELPKKDMRNIGPPPGLEHTARAVNGVGKATPLKKKQLLPGTRLTAQASPFVPVFAPKKTGATKEFTGAFHELDKSLSKLNCAMAEWDVCLSKDRNAEKPARHQAPPSCTPLKAPKATAAFVPMWQVPADCRPASQLWQQFPQAAAVTGNGPKTGKTGKAPADVAATQLAECLPTSGSIQEQSSADQQLEKDSLRTNLRDLEHMDGDRVLIVRRINRLGLESPALLEEYFSQYGPVEKVLVSHSRAKSYFGYSSARVRPAGLGFVVMSRTEDAEAILQAGANQVVSGATITVHAYETRSGDTKEIEQAQMSSDSA